MSRKWLVLAFASAVIIAIACAGKTTSDTTDGGLSSACPAQPPQDSSYPCSNVGLECEYGTDTDIACDAIARCDTKGWTVTPPKTQGCPTPAPGPACPSSYSSVPTGSTCTTATSCAYPQGTCSCEVYCGPQYPLSHPCEAGTPMTWHCDGAPQGCPDSRPRVGSDCAQNGLTCTYGDCNTIGVQCTGGTWHTENFGCPISSRHYKQGIHYLSDDELEKVADQALSTRLATYEYTIGAPDERLGFIIEDEPASYAVSHGKDRVDLYGYASMSLAALKVQQREIEELRREVSELRADCHRP